MLKINLYPEPCQESELSQQEIAMDLSAAVSDTTDILEQILKNCSETEKSSN